MSTDDRAWIAAIRNRDQDACDRLRNACYVSIHRCLIIWRWPQADDDAEDLAQDLTIRIIHIIDADENNIRSLQGFIARSAYNACNDYVRQARRNRLDDRASYIIDDIPPPNPNEFNERIDALIKLLPLLFEDPRMTEHQQAVIRCWLALPSNKKDLLMAYAVKEFSYSQVAKQLNRSRGYVSGTISRARSDLSGCLQRHGLDLRKI